MVTHTHTQRERERERERERLKATNRHTQGTIKALIKPIIFVTKFIFFGKN